MNIYLLTAVTIFLSMNLVFLLAFLKRDNSIVDIFWGLGFCIVSGILAYNFQPFTVRKLFVLILVFVWGLRLSIYLYIRNSGRGEDWRYKKWREDWGSNWAWRSYLQVFILQGLFMFIILLPVIHVFGFSNDNIGFLDFIGSLVWLIGYYFEAVGDYQLMQFKKDPANKGKIMRYGVWARTRHPNYFGEMAIWWGIFIISLNVHYWYISIIGPITITWLLTKVSGVPMLENKYKNDPEYQEYIKNTPALFPKI